MKYILTFEYETDESMDDPYESLFTMMACHLEHNKTKVCDLEMIDVEESDL